MYFTSLIWFNICDCLGYMPIVMPNLCRDVVVFHRGSSFVHLNSRLTNVKLYLSTELLHASIQQNRTRSFIVASPIWNNRLLCVLRMGLWLLFALGCFICRSSKPKTRCFFDELKNHPFLYVWSLIEYFASRSVATWPVCCRGPRPWFPFTESTRKFFHWKQISQSKKRNLLSPWKISPCEYFL